ncbi:hypothetical protein K438DRAFT_1937248 [Mycena galopus ATCC 62051]|nr:hypothetical protein K438DRAFT_1937248 [Mycena galopus ATCC 62051]
MSTPSDASRRAAVRARPHLMMRTDMEKKGHTKNARTGTGSAGLGVGNGQAHEVEGTCLSAGAGTRLVLPGEGGRRAVRPGSRATRSGTPNGKGENRHCGAGEDQWTCVYCEGEVPRGGDGCWRIDVHNKCAARLDRVGAGIQTAATKIDKEGGAGLVCQILSGLSVWRRLPRRSIPRGESPNVASGHTLRLASFRSLVTDTSES